MSSQRRLQPARTPYTQVLSALRKVDLVRLCEEFRLPTVGSVVELRTRIKDYLNLHRETLYRNARYTALFPRFRKINQAPPPSPSPPHSPTLSYTSGPSDSSYGSWHGVDEHDDGEPAAVIQDIPQQPIVQNHHHHHHEQPHQPQEHPYPVFNEIQEPHPHFLPHPSPPPNSDHGSLHPVVHAGDGREYLHLYLCARSF